MSVIQLIAPSGFCHNLVAAERGIERLVSAGHQVRGAEHLHRRYQRFAGTDAQRLDDINALACLPNDTDIVLAVRGGYGASRLLADIDYSALGQRFEHHLPAICGHSDFTALQLALLTILGTVTFSSPMLVGNFGAVSQNLFTWQAFWQAISEPRFTLNWTSPSSSPFTARGTVWGGNLTLLCSLIGTPWFPPIRDGILVLEDVNEHPYRVERMLLQLLYSGVLNNQKAIIMGTFTGATLDDYDAGFALPAVKQRLERLLDIPLIDGLPFGHDSATVTLPFGACGTLCHDGTQAALTLSGHPVLSSHFSDRF